ncbi:DUF1778 domain-containing protein [Stenotrophomonas oahuensis]|uniref:DUF1778 domain-containing protein n=1 Tax=Stenotrophomonas oahuensis TaxID=3003271 RepID=A0ABY9YTH9_9GAMM|nr:DUF1778 domain-containing protein [Stenotrophomonas sp. A5586]WNH54221.1 DUF1778 domain-containing protein [Stenotrophomonas sp. A5586]
MTTHTARLSLRQNPAVKEWFARAAEPIVILSEEESRRFLDALDAPFQPNAKLKKALARLTTD